MDIHVVTSITTETATFEKSGDTLIINGEVFDFSPLQEGERLPMSAINSTFFAGAVERHNGELIIPIRMPISELLAETIGYPAPLIGVPDGPLNLPKEPMVYDPELAPETAQEGTSNE